MVGNGLFRCINAIISKTGNRAAIVVSLCTSYCIPVLVFGVEVMELNKTENNRLASCTNKLFAKLFGTFDNSLFAYCYYYMSF